jgi:hypothetical protein
METQVQETEVTTAAPVTPLEFIQKNFPNAPSGNQVDIIRAQVPNGRLKVFVSSDQKRAYIMRGISAIELQTLQDERMRVTQDNAKLVFALKADIVVKCCVWASTKDSKLTDLTLKGSGAGLVDTLYELVNQLSDYTDPETLFQLSSEI